MMQTLKFNCHNQLRVYIGMRNLTLHYGHFEKNWDSQLQYVGSLFNISCNTNITTKI
jgi:hypothetical protein